MVVHSSGLLRSNGSCIESTFRLLRHRTVWILPDVLTHVLVSVVWSYNIAPLYDETLLCVHSG